MYIELFVTLHIYSTLFVRHLNQLYTIILLHYVGIFDFMLMCEGPLCAYIARVYQELTTSIHLRMTMSISK